jgi:hypothetical protein
MRLHRKARATLHGSRLRTALPISLLAVAMDSTMSGLLFGLPLLAATCASIVAWQATKGY